MKFQQDRFEQELFTNRLLKKDFHMNTTAYHSAISRLRTPPLLAPLHVQARARRIVGSLLLLALVLFGWLPSYASSYYSHTTIAQTGATFDSVSSYPSIADGGMVAFVAQMSGEREGIFLGDGTALPVEITSGNPVGANGYGQAVQIRNSANNNYHVVAQNHLANFGTRIHVWSTDLTIPPKLIAAGGSSSSDTFASVFEFPSINGSGQVVFAALPKGSTDNTVLATPNGSGFNIATFFGIDDLRPIIDGTGRIAVRVPAGSATSVRSYANDVKTFTSIANSGLGYIQLGQSPEITDDGSVAAFVGNRGNGLGLFINFVGLSGSRITVNIAGENAIVPKSELGLLAANTPLFFKDFDLTNRVAVKSIAPQTTSLSNAEVLICFAATPNLAASNVQVGNQALSFSATNGIWTLRGFLRQSGSELAFVRESVFPVIQIGDPVGPGALLPVDNFVIYDPLATITSSPTSLQSAYVAFWASSGGSQAIVRSSGPGAIPDLVTNSLSWNTAQGGMTFQYEVRSGPLTNATSAKLFWADGTATNNIIPGLPVIFTQNIPAGASGTSAAVNVSASQFANPPSGATHVLLVLDYDSLLRESDSANNVAAIEIPGFELVDAMTFQQGGVLPTDPSQYFSGGQSRVGAVADGASRLILRVNLGTIDIVGLNLHFTLSGGGSQGRLRPLNADTWSSDVPAALATQSSSSKALCIYESPVDFPDSAPTATVQLLNDTTVIATKQIQIKRPPVVLVHGIWSSPDEAWVKTGAAASIDGQVGQSQNGFPVTLADYQSSNSGPFDGNALRVYVSVLDAISKARDPSQPSYACSKVDIVAHSMGGLLSRLMAQRYGLQNDNYSKGNLHKLITVGTPHQGSFMADELVELYVAAFTDPLPRYDVLRVLLALPPPKLLYFGGAAFQLSTFTPYSGIPDIAQVEVPSHAIVGRATALQEKTDLWKLYTILRWLLPPDGVDWRPGVSDAMVMVESQIGGLSGAVTYLTGAIAHTAETGNSGFKEEAGRLLRAVASGGDFDPAGFRPFYGLPYFRSTVTPKDLSLGNTNTDWLQISSPTNGQAVSVGEQITFSVRAKDGRPLNAVGIFGLSEVLVLTNAPFQTLISVPQDAIGVLNLAVLANDTTNQLGCNAVSLKVTTTASLRSIIVDPSPVALRFTADTPLIIAGVFSDAIQRDITSAEAGTTYGSSDSSRVSVDTNGVLRAIQNTVAPVTISITNGPIWTNVQVTVDLINLPPTAVISTDVTNAVGYAPMSIRFDASASNDPEMSQLTYKWDFGDGTTSDQKIPTLHTFSPPGSYNVRLVVSDSLGLRGTSDLLVTVLPAVRLEVHYTNGLPRVTLFGKSGVPHILEVSTNLQNWFPLITNAPVNGSFEFLETNSATFRQRFYWGLRP